MPDTLKRTPLYELHVALGAKMVPFAGYEMPVQYTDGVLKEHLHTRAAAGLFDVSHMGQAYLTTTGADLGADGAHDEIAAAVETLIPGEIARLKAGGLRYSALLNDAGGILDDLMVTRLPEPSQAGRLFLVVNAACKDQDFEVFETKLAGRAALQRLDDRALLALQGPTAAGVIEALFPETAGQRFMTMRRDDWEGTEVFLSRCGYTGEDGFEISIPAEAAEGFAHALLAHEDVRPIGLGARDSLRLEAGLCLYGHDLDETTSPVEGNIAFIIGKRRRAQGGFPGEARIFRELAEGPKRLRVGLIPEGRAPAREGADIQSADGETIGTVTSGGFGPSLGGPVAMGYVDVAHAETGTPVQLIVRGKALPARVADMPFVPPNYFRGPATT